MEWLNKTVDEIIARQPDGEVVVSSGVSPSGTYHLGTMREVMTAEAIMRELKRRGRACRHIHVADDLDVFRKVPAGIPEEYEKYLGKPLCDIPSPADPNQTYADYYLNDLLVAAEPLRLEMEVMRAHEKYREGFFVEAIEKALDKIADIRKILETVSGHKLGEDWSPVQVIEGGYLKNRRFVSIDKDAKTIVYLDQNGQEQTISYAKGEVKLNWRIDWPARWWLLHVTAEPFGRDHATKGGSYDTGAEIIRQVYDAEPPLSLPYDFINRTGDTKKMSKSAGNTITAAELLEILPAEVVWYFILRYPPSKLLYFDQGPTLIKLIDDFGALLAKPDKTESEQQLVDLCLQGIEQPTVSSVPFSHLVASYQAALRDSDRTLEIIGRTEYGQSVEQESDVIKNELSYIDNWLEKYAPEDIKFELSEKPGKLSASDQDFLNKLAVKIEAAPEDADGEWFHKTIYELAQSEDLSPKAAFEAIYKATINQDHGPRAGWFLSILPRDWLIDRLKSA